jgi:futalosine hydrolase
MSLKILYVTATNQEAEAIIKVEGIKTSSGKFHSGSWEIELLVAGVGTMSTAWSMTRWISVNDKPDLVINAGIAGSYKEDFPVGCVVMPVSDCFADAGIEDGDRFLTVHESGLVNSDEFPFVQGSIPVYGGYAEKLKNILKPVKAITVNTATGSDMTIRKLSDKFNPDIETMEGAAFFYICARERIPFLALRAISNKVERRDKNKWDIPLALNNLELKLEEVFKILEE